MEKSDSKKVAGFLAAFVFAYSSFISTLDAIGIDFMPIVISAGVAGLVTGVLSYYYMEFKLRKTKNKKQHDAN